MTRLMPQQFMECLRNGRIPPHPPEGVVPQGDLWWHLLSSADMDSFRLSYDLREFAIKRGMWALVDRVWTRQLAEWIGDRWCLEVMAGKGWLAKALHEFGVDVLATDDGNWARHSEAPAVFDIVIMEAQEAVREYGQGRDLLIVSWPPYDDDAVCRVCELWGSDRPVVYIGEVCGCNAPEEFFDRFEQIEHPQFPMMQWWGLHDEVMIGYYGRRCCDGAGRTEAGEAGQDPDG